MDPFTRLSEVLEHNEYLADLFLILHFDELGEARGEQPVLHVPASIDQLFTHEPSEANELLAKLVSLVREDARTLEANQLTALVARIRSNYLQYRGREMVRPIADEADEEIFELMHQLIPEPSGVDHLGRLTLEGSLLKKVAGTIRKSVTTTLSVSKRTGMGILMRGRDFSKLIRDRVAQLELPSRRMLLSRRRLSGHRGFMTSKVGTPPRFSWASLSVASVS